MASHQLSIPSMEPETQVAPSGDTAQQDNGLGAAGRAVTCWPLELCHKRSEPSQPADSTYALSGVCTQEKTSPPCPSPLPATRTLIVRMALLPSLAKITHRAG